MALLVLPASLSEPCGLPREVHGVAQTVRELLRALGAAHPELGRRLLDEAGEPRGYYSLFRNDDDLRRVGGLDAPLAEDDVVTVLPPVAGGASQGEPGRPMTGDRPDWLAEACGHAEAVRDQEACGLIVRTPAGLSIRKTRNLARLPGDHFEIDPEGLLAAAASGTLAGIYHSHVGAPATLSCEDLEAAALWSGLAWVVISLVEGRARECRAYVVEGGKASERPIASLA